MQAWSSTATGCRSRRSCSCRRQRPRNGHLGGRGWDSPSGDRHASLKSDQGEQGTQGSGHAPVTPPEPLRIENTRRERFNALQLPQSPLAIIDLLSVHRRRRPTPVAARVVKAPANPRRFPKWAQGTLPYSRDDNAQTLDDALDMVTD